MGVLRYFILEQDPPAPAVSRRGLQGMGFGPLQRAGPAALAPRPVKVSTAEMSPGEAASERKREGVRIVGAAMPIRLIAPLARSGPVPAAAPGGSAWGIKATGADTSPFDGAGAAVAVLDTGIKRDHPTFAGIDFTNAVRDFTDDAGTADDLNGHGSHCAGTILGRDVDGTRIGIARGVTRLLVGKVLPDDRSGDSAMLFDALNWASREGANIVSMSLGFDFPGMVEQLVESDGLPRPVAVSNALVVFGQNLRAFDAVMASFRAGQDFGRNMLVVGAAGNESRRDKDADYRISASLPAAATGVISVAAYGKKGAKYEIAPFSNRDALICAPGVDILSADINGGLVEMSGTSQACPHIAGLAALWWQKIVKSGENASPDKVRERMLVSAVTTKLPPEADESERGRGRAVAPAN
jgi:subtilisin family serine protease